MFTLIKRELSDIWALAFLFAGIECMFCFLGIGLEFIIGSTAVIIVFLSLMLGVVQSSTDVSRKYSSFLMSLPVTRKQIYLARIISGIAAIGTICLMGYIACELFIKYKNELMPSSLFITESSLLARIYLFIMLASLVGYGHGITMGGYSEKDYRILFAVFFGIMLFMLPIYIVYLKGMNIYTALWLLIWSGAILTLGYCKFKQRPL